MHARPSLLQAHRACVYACGRTHQHAVRSNTAAVSGNGTPTNDVVSPLPHFVNLHHGHAVDRAVSSDRLDMQVTLQDLAGSDAAIDKVTAVHHDKPLVKTQYGLVRYPLLYGRSKQARDIWEHFHTYPCHLPMDKVALHNQEHPIDSYLPRTKLAHLV
jgi:hypothetical protein